MRSCDSAGIPSRTSSTTKPSSSPSTIRSSSVTTAKPMAFSFEAKYTKPTPRSYGTHSCTPDHCSTSYSRHDGNQRFMTATNMKGFHMSQPHDTDARIATDESRPEPLLADELPGTPSSDVST